MEGFREEDFNRMMSRDMLSDTLAHYIVELGEDRAEIGTLKGKLGSEDAAERTRAYETLGLMLETSSQALELVLRYVSDERAKSKDSKK